MPFGHRLTEPTVNQRGYAFGTDSKILLRNLTYTHGKISTSTTIKL